MFRRTSKQDEVLPPTHSEGKGPGAKGRPTPTRREAEAAARERSKTVMDKKTAKKVLRERQSVSNAKVREGMRRGDERYLPARDQGPVKRFVRDYIDSRFSVAEFLLPLLVVIMVMQYSGQRSLVAFSNVLWTTTLLLVALDTVWLVLRLKKQLRQRFPDEPMKGVNFYAILRVMQLRVLRMPKPKVKLGGAPK